MRLSEEEGDCLKVQDLSVRYRGDSTPFAVNGFDLRLRRKKIVGLAGESGCGKSTSALALMGFNRAGETVSGISLFADTNLLQQSETKLRKLWGNRICYVPQSASLALNPAITVGKQLAQPLVEHMGLSGKALRDRQIGLFTSVGLPDPEQALERYPFQFSGGQQQRIVLAIALCCEPDILILDEPTTGLDVTTQARISQLLRREVERLKIAALYVSHDLALLRGLTDELAIMYAGQIVEQGPTLAVSSRPSHPYTKLLLGLSPRIDDPRIVPGIPGIPPAGVIFDKCAFEPRCPYSKERCRTGPVALRPFDEDKRVRCVRAEALRSTYPEAINLSSDRAEGSKTLLKVDDLTLRYLGVAHNSVDHVTFELPEGGRLGIVGESGSGKSTILRMIAGLIAPTGGAVRFDGTPLAPLALKRARNICQQIQLIFQNPDGSLNPRHTLHYILSRPLVMFRPELGRQQRADEISKILDQVRLPTSALSRYPAHLSGGQRQRVAIARAFLARPRLLLCDEITSALDVSVQAAILQLIAELCTQRGTAVMFVSHDLALVRTIADRTIVMRNGKIVEDQRSDTLFAQPQAEYTRELLAAIPR